MMDWIQKQKFIAALCACPSLINEDSRRAIILELPESIRNPLRRADSLQTEVTNLLNACMDYENGVEDLLGILHFYERESLPMQVVAELWAEMGCPAANGSHEIPQKGTSKLSSARTHPAKLAETTAQRREQHQWMTFTGAGLLSALPLILIQTHSLGCVLQSINDTNIKVFGFLIVGITAAVNAIPGAGAIKKVKLFSGGFAFGLLLLLVYTFLSPDSQKACQPNVPITSPTATLTATASFTPTPTLSTPSAQPTFTPQASPTMTETPVLTNTMPPTAAVTITPAPSETATPTLTASVTPSPTQTFTPTATATPTPYPTRIAPTDQARMVLIPAGRFILGANTGSDANAAPEQTPYLNSFWIDQTEITNAMYEQCVQTGACKAPIHSYSSTISKYYGNPVYGSYPVIFVSWYQAKTYCEWAGRRLPSEAEWEKAARGIEGNIFPWGGSETVPPDCSQANFKGCSQDVVKVGRYPNAASPYGVLDLAGNVAEWTNSRFMPYPYDPSDGRENLTARGKDILRVIRGGSWLSDPMAIKGYYRSEILKDPAQPFKPESVSSLVGFRCAMDGD